MNDHPSHRDPRQELLRRLTQEDSNLWHRIARIHDAQEAGGMNAAQADEAIQAARADHANWCRTIREAWTRQQGQQREREGGN